MTDVPELEFFNFERFVVFLTAKTTKKFNSSEKSVKNSRNSLIIPIVVFKFFFHIPGLTKITPNENV